MIEDIKTILSFVKNNFLSVALAGVVMVCAIVVLIGILKPLVINKISNKNIRKSVLAASSVAGSFLATAIYFWIMGFNFVYYLYAVVAVLIATVITYWLYENTNLRTGIKKLGTLVLEKVFPLALNYFANGDKETIKAEIVSVGEDLKEANKETLAPASKTVQGDSELKNL